MSNNNQQKVQTSSKTTVEKLADKVSLVLKKHHDLTGDNEVQRNEIAELKATLEAKNKEIEALKEENEMKEMEIEEIVSKIESILG
jgi:chromosome segregation ATPase